MGVLKQARANSQDYLGRESIPDDDSTTGLRVPKHELFGSKKIETYQEFLKLASGPSKGVNVDGVRFLKPLIKDVFHNH